MLKLFTVLLVTLSLLPNIACGIDRARDSVRMPEGFDGIYLGMCVNNLLQIRPEADVPPMEKLSPGQKVDLSKSNQSLQEQLEQDPLSGLELLANYNFKDGELENVLIVWAGNIDRIRERRQKLLSFCIENWGRDFERRILRLEPNRPKEHLAPLLLWNSGNTMIIAVCTSEYGNKTPQEGVFMIGLSLRNDSEANKIFAGESIDESLRDELFNKIGIASTGLE